MSWKFPGGLLKYTPVKGMTGADRLRIIGATMQDMANGGGGELSGVHDDIYERIQQNQTQSERHLQPRRMFDQKPKFLQSTADYFPRHARGGTAV